MTMLNIFVIVVLISSLELSSFVTSQSGTQLLFIRSQCKTKCLSYFSQPNQGKDLPSQESDKGFEKSSNNIGDPCFDNLNKKQCNQLQCKNACDTNPTTCLQRCSENSRFCRLGCFYLTSSMSQRPGICSKPDSISPSAVFPGQSSDCSNACSSDSGCFATNYKCCPTLCGKKCVKPVLNDSIPPMAHKLTPVYNKKVNKLDLDWSVLYENLQTPSNINIFILQIRYCICRHFRASYMTDWQTLIVTPKMGARLDAFDVGKIYQFRLAAVSPSGTRGFGLPSEPYPLRPPAPRPPRPPRNVTDGMWRFFAGGKISVTITWAESKQSDIPISEYRIKWVHDHGYVQSDGNSLEGLTKYAQSAPPSSRQHTIENLDPDTSYKVQVYAVSSWEGQPQKLVSQPNTIFISTPSLRPAQKPNYHPKYKTSNHKSFTKTPSANCPCKDDPKFESKLKVLKPEFFEGQLTVNILLTTVTTGKDTPYTVHWSREVCIDSEENSQIGVQGVMTGIMQKRLYRLTKLNFNCRYSVTLEPLTATRKPSDSPTAHTCFCTPSCPDLYVPEDTTAPACAPDTSRLPASPSNLHIQLVDRKALNYELSWRAPSSRRTRQSPVAKGSQQRLLGGAFSRYRVVWGPRQQEPVNKEMYNDEAGFTPILDFRHSDVRVLPNNVTSLTLTGLKPATFYIVRVQTLSIDEQLSRESESATAVHYFTTLGFRNPDSPRFYPGSQVARFIKPNSNCERLSSNLWTILTLTVITVSLYLTNSPV